MRDSQICSSVLLNRSVCVKSATDTFKPCLLSVWSGRRETVMPTKSTCLKLWSSWGSSTPGGSSRFAFFASLGVSVFCVAVCVCVCVGRWEKFLIAHLNPPLLLLPCHRGLSWLPCPATSLTPSTETLLRNSMTSLMTPPPQVHASITFDTLPFLTRFSLSDTLPPFKFLPVACG